MIVRVAPSDPRLFAWPSQHSSGSHGFGPFGTAPGLSLTPKAHAENLAEFINRLNPNPFTLVVHDYGGPIGLPLCLQHPERVKRLVLLNTWMWSFEGDREMVRKAWIVGGRFGRFLYRWGIVSLRVLMPQAYGDKDKLTPDQGAFGFREFL